MEQQNDLNRAVIEVLNEYVQLPTSSEITRHLMMNADKTEFWLLKMGWNQRTRIHATTAHIEIRNGLIWIHRDETEEGLATELEGRGILKSQIVLAFHNPIARALTDYATGQ